VTGWFRDSRSREGLFSSIVPADVTVLQPIGVPRSRRPPLGAVAAGAKGAQAQQTAAADRRRRV